MNRFEKFRSFDYRLVVIKSLATGCLGEKFNLRDDWTVLLLLLSNLLLSVVECVVVDSDGVVFVAGVVSGVHVFEASVC